MQMSISKRLFLSNMLMLIVPVVLSVGISYMILFIFTRSSSDSMERAYPLAFEVIFRFRQNKDVDVLQEDVLAFNQEFQDTSTFMAVFHKNRFLFPENSVQLLSASMDTLSAILEADATGNFTLNGARVAVERSGDYQIIVVDRQGPPDGKYYGRPMISHVAMLLGILLVMIIVTNRLLTNLLTKRITASLDILALGVHELRDGNLDYRIAYQPKDEFAPVCDDFNEMAEHLQALILRQRRDEASRKELLASISHDLRTPLTSIKAYVEGLMDGVAEDMPTQLRYLGIIRTKAEDIDGLVDQLFLFSKLDIGEFPFYEERMDIGEMMSGMIEAVGEEYENKGMTLLLTHNAEGAFVSADPGQLRVALSNILENSVKYKDKEKIKMEVECYASGKSVIIRMTDNGPGVPEESLDKLFDVFYRSDPSRQNPSRGSGLGLAIAYKIFARLGGGIRAENAEGGGLRMIIRLPLLEEEAGNEENLNN